MGEALVGKGRRSAETHAGLGLTRPSLACSWVPQNCPAFRRGTYNQGIIHSYQNPERDDNFPSQSLQGGLGSPPQGLLSHATRCPHVCQPVMMGWGGAAEVDKCLLGSWQMVLGSLSNLGASGRAITEDVRLMCVCAHSLSHSRFFATPWTVNHQASLTMGFSRQED